jgi:nicotinamide-nucleotide adenylyltransferase
MAKQFKLGLYVGRFQGLHKSHCKAIDILSRKCDRVLILVGSAQESRTERNPYSSKTRIKFLDMVYGDREDIIIEPLIDYTDENDICIEWGDYLLRTVHLLTGEYPDCMISSGDDITGWFAPEIDNAITKIYLERDMTATELRKAIAIGDMDKVKEMTHPAIHGELWELRKKLLQADFYFNMNREYIF